MAIPINKDELQEAVDLLHKFGTGFAAARHCNLPSSTIRNRAMKGLKIGLKPNTKTIQSEAQLLKKQVHDLRAELAVIEQKNLDCEDIKSTIFKMVNLESEVPDWTV